MRPHRARRDEQFAELQRIESDPEFRALFLAELNVSLDARNAARAAESEGWCVAVDRLLVLVEPDRERAP
ncbi:hypothetical protein [Streptomyces sp. NPDC048332]|uniref:hypothetical protein n=1 Tax=unclassified Streptomyces TaxID=2593676 RepID=UPI003433572B